ncbi:hypothetical protein HQ585_04005 [candidate division KSB1 bacterium]|nr:hypothetical protein [candidate division KSB1 bacterium]
MKRFLALLVVVALMGTGSLFAADFDDHTVTVDVTAISEVAITGGNITITINSATAGSEPGPETDATCDLSWTTNEAAQKITVVSSIASPVYPLTVTAGTVSGGVTGGTCTLNTTAKDFVTGVATTVGTCDMEYSASAAVTNGTGNEAHTVTYTMIDAI